MIKNAAGAGLFLGIGNLAFSKDSYSGRGLNKQLISRIPKMKITNVETIATGRDIFVKIESFFSSFICY